jgi:hypothetical protein
VRGLGVSRPTLLRKPVTDLALRLTSVTSTLGGKKRQRTKQSILYLRTSRSLSIQAPLSERDPSGASGVRQYCPMLSPMQKFLSGASDSRLPPPELPRRCSIGHDPQQRRVVQIVTRPSGLNVEPSSFACWCVRSVGVVWLYCNATARSRKTSQS